MVVYCWVFEMKMGPSAIPVAVGAPGGVWLRLLCASILILLCERQTQSSLPEFFKTGGIVFKKVLRLFLNQISGF